MTTVDVGMAAAYSPAAPALARPDSGHVRSTWLDQWRSEPLLARLLIAFAVLPVIAAGLFAALVVAIFSGLLPFLMLTPG